MSHFGWLVKIIINIAGLCIIGVIISPSCFYWAEHVHYGPALLIFQSGTSWRGLRQAQAHGRRLSSSFGASDGEDFAFDGAMMILKTITSGWLRYGVDWYKDKVLKTMNRGCMKVEWVGATFLPNYEDTTGLLAPPLITIWMVDTFHGVILR